MCIRDSSASTYSHPAMPAGACLAHSQPEKCVLSSSHCPMLLTTRLRAPFIWPQGLCKGHLTDIKPFRPSLTGFTQALASGAPTRWTKAPRHERSSGPPPIDRHERTACAHRSASRHPLELDARRPLSSPPRRSMEPTEALLAAIIPVSYTHLTLPTKA